MAQGNFAVPRLPPRQTGQIEYEVQHTDSYVWSSADLLGRGATSHVFKGFSKVLYFYYLYVSVFILHFQIV